jgi:glycosyltransferase involved in cell wall biosynthesis
LDKPKVLLLSQEVHPIPPLKGAAVEQWIDAVARGMGRYVPHIVSVPHPDLPDIHVEGRVHYNRIRIGRLYNRLFRKLTRLDPHSYIDRLIAYARRVAPSIIHIHNAPQFVRPIREALHGIPMILHMHNEKEARILPPVDVLCGCSRYISEWYRGGRISATHFMELPNGVDIAQFRPSWFAPEEVQQARARFGVPDDRFVVLYVGRISPEKGPDLLVEAMRQLDPTRFHAVLAGEWQKGDPARSERAAYGARLRKAMEGLPVTIIDARTPEAMPEIYRLGDLLLIPSRFEEPFSMAAIEAMASGVPVLALRKGGMVEYMRDGENALLMPADAGPDLLARAIASAAANPERLAQLARAARAMVEARFSWERVVARTEAFYDELLASHA